MKTTTIVLWGLCGVTAVLAGCSNYYRVNDPAGTREYYTTDIDRTKSGAITFKDE
jgi:expansin (peptidoglycan-binding protein)